MRTRIAVILTVILLASIAGLVGGTPARAADFVIPPENIAGLTPGVSTVRDATRLMGPYDVALPGVGSHYAGGPLGTTGYYWVPGSRLSRTGVSVETLIGSPTIILVAVQLTPGVYTSRGLSTLVGENVAASLYGMPDFAYELRLNDDLVVRELYYMNQGLMVILRSLNGRPNWMVTDFILTSPSYLAGAVNERARIAVRGGRVEDMTYSYRVWARMAVPPA
ncbi:MAG TPA: hypothetical protein VGM23_11520 [Armatimonadota bacterium]|jgi:hypothetical protein